MRDMTDFRRRALRALTALLLTGLLTAAAFSQAVNTRLNGNVRDVQGAVIPNATVTIVDNATGSTKTATTNDSGFFEISDLRQGSYTVNVEATGFKRASVADVQVNVDQTATVNLSLEVGQVTEVVNVSAADAQAVVNTENAEIKNTVFERQINDLPLNGRNPLDLAGLQAGVNSASEDTRSATVNGLRGSFTNLTWDGININDNFIRTDSFFGVSAPSVVSVSEFSLTTQNAGPGDGLGVAQVKLVTPRGSNEFHGTLFWYHRNDALDANSFFNNRSGLPKEKLIQNQFGFGIGGPFVLPNVGDDGPRWFGKDRLFFYAYYEGTLERSDASLNRIVLTQAARQGDFTYIRQDNGQPQTVNLLDLGGLSIDPLIQQRLALTPLPNNTEEGDAFNSGGFRFNSPSGSDSHLWGFRIDFDASEKHRFEAIYSRFKFDSPNDTFNDIGEVFPGLPGTGQGSVRPRGSFAWIWLPTANFNNELRGGFQSSNPSFITRETFDEGFILNFPFLGINTDDPRVSTNPVRSFLPQGRDVSVYEVMDNASWVLGDHSIRFGGNFRYVRVQPFNNFGVIPAYNIGFGTGNPDPLDPENAAQFPGGISSTDALNASATLALLSGSLSDVTQTFNVQDRESGFVPGLGDVRDLRNYTIGIYGGDTWRIRPNLTVNFGLRYEFISVPTEKNGLALLPVGGLDALFDPNAVLDFAGTDDRPFFKTDWDNFAPNISFAWDPFNDGKTSIRGGYSVSYVIDNNITTIRNAFIGNSGLSADRTITGISGTVSTGGIVPIDPPEFEVPRTISQNIALDPTSAIFTIDPDFETPFVQQWNIGISRELFANTALEVRYVGNRGIGLSRGFDLNQVRIFDNGFLDDFRRAQANLAACGAINPVDCAGAQTLQILPRFGLGGFLDSGTVINFVRNGEVGELASFYLINRDFFLNGAFGGDPSLTPSFFARANPNAFVADFITNGSFSSYHGLQAEIRRRFSDGLYFQANYTYSRGFTDFEGSQTSFLPLLDIDRGGVVEKRRPVDDITHVFKANAIYELPVGPGRMFLDYGGWAGKLLGGWSIGGLLRWQSGEPISIVSARGTLNRRGRSATNTVNTNLTVQEIQENTGLFFDPDTGQPRLFPVGFESNFTNPPAGTLGNLQLTPVSGPSVLFLDMSLIKRTRITEDINFEFRVEAFNVLNRTNFDVFPTNQNINSPTFGFITETFAPRIIQFAGKINF